MRRRLRNAFIGQTGACGLGSMPSCQRHPRIRSITFGSRAMTEIGTSWLAFWPVAVAEEGGPVGLLGRDAGEIEPSPTSSQGMSRGMLVHGKWLEMRSTYAKTGRRSRLASSRRCRAARTYWASAAAMVRAQTTPTIQPAAPSRARRRQDGEQEHLGDQPGRRDA